MKNEINLLPQVIQRARMTRIYNRRIHRIANSILVAVFLVVLGQGASILAVKQSLANIVSKVDVSDSQGRQDNRQVATDNELITEVKKRLDGQPAWSTKVGSVLQAVPDNFSVLELRADTDTHKLTITASTTSRVAGIVYEKALNALPWVQTVDAPLQNFALSDKNEVTFHIYTKEVTP